MSLSPGRLLAGRYRLDTHIATGGMGEVWRAEDTVLRRVVAVKVLNSALARDDVFRERFAAEARIVAALRTRGIVAIHDAVETTGEDGRPLAFLVMEHIDGVSLATLLQQEGRLDPGRTMSIVAQAADALDAAHRAGIVHRDVKPDNIIVGPGDHVTIVDFGVARIQGESTLTATGSILATIRYAAPEQLSGKELGFSADIYALGVVAYECLAGEPPFTGESVPAIVAGHLLRQPPPLPPEIPTAVAGVVSRALAKEPERRHPSAAAFGAACRKGSTEPSPTWSLPFGALRGDPAWARRLRTGAVIAAVVVMAAALVISRLDRTPPVGDAASGSDGSSSGTVVTGTNDVPPTPADSRLANASTGQCLHAESDVRLAECASAATIDFAGADGTYLLVLDEGGQRRCLAPSAVQIETGTCGDDESWTVTWLGTGDGGDRWRMESTAYAGRCLSVAEMSYEDDDGGDGKGKGNGHDKGKGKKNEPTVHLSPSLAPCGKGEDQVWLTG